MLAFSLSSNKIFVKLEVLFLYGIEWCQK